MKNPFTHCESDTPPCKGSGPNLCDECYAYNAFEIGRESGIALERARVVAWLRTSPACLRAACNTIYGPYQDAADLLAEALENDDAMAIGAELGVPR